MSCPTCSTRLQTSSTVIGSSVVTSTVAALTRRLTVSCRLYWMHTICVNSSRHTPTYVTHQQPTRRRLSEWRIVLNLAVERYATHSFSDHDLVTRSWTSSVRQPRRVLTHQFRNLKSVDWTMLDAPNDSCTSPANELADELDDTVTSILDGHAQFKNVATWHLIITTVVVCLLLPLMHNVYDDNYNGSGNQQVKKSTTQRTNNHVVLRTN